MAFEDLKENLSAEFKNRWEQFQESSVYIQIREQYENLTPPKQKAALAALFTFLTIMLLYLPLSYYSASSNYVAEFEDKRQLIRDLLKTSREVQEIPDIPVPPDVNSLKAQVEGQIRSAQLLPEQVRGSEVTPADVKIIPGALVQSSLRVTLSQLNLRQIIDLGHQFQSISPSIKMTDLQMEANAKDPRYYDVVYKLAVLAVPEKVVAPPEPEPPKKKGK